MIRTMLHDRKTGETRRGDEGLFSAWSASPDLWIWADFDNEEPVQEQTHFRETFGFHPLVVADAQRERHPPKLELFDDYFLLLMNGLDAMADEMFENPRDALLEELIAYGRNLKRLRRIFNYHRGLFERLSRKDQPFIGKQDRHEFIDVYEHTERLASLATLFKELTDDLMNGYISVTSHRLNQIMKVLTVVTVIFLPFTLLVGIYGMNFEHMPELKIEKAYFVFLGVMASIVVGLLLLFRKMRWL